VYNSWYIFVRVHWLLVGSEWLRCCDVNHFVCVYELKNIALCADPVRLPFRRRVPTFNSFVGVLVKFGLRAVLQKMPSGCERL
jgi:hypothetical protein